MTSQAPSGVHRRDEALRHSGSRSRRTATAALAALAVLAAMLVATVQPAAAAPSASLQVLTPTVGVGDPIVYRVTVVNPDNAATTVNSITHNVTGPGADPTVTCLPAPAVVVNADSSQNFTCTSTATVAANVGTQSNTATIAFNVGPSVVTNSVNAEVQASNPDLSVSITGPASIGKGDVINYGVTVQNTGNRVLTNVRARVPGSNNCANAAGQATVPNTIPLGGSAVLNTCTFNTAPLPLTTTSHSSGLVAARSSQTGNNNCCDRTGNTVLTSIEAAVRSVSVVKSTPQANVPVGVPVPYTIAVENTGNTTLGTVRVTDLGTGCANTLVPASPVIPPGTAAGVLAPGQTKTVTCTRPGPAAIGQQIDNIAQVTASPALPAPAVAGVVESNEVTVTGVAATSSVDVDLSAPATALQGDDFLWTVAITNTGNGTLTNVRAFVPGTNPDCAPAPGKQVPALPAPGTGAGVLAPGQTKTVTCTEEATFNVPENGVTTRQATVTGTAAAPHPPLQPQNSNPASVTVTQQAATLSVVKSAPTAVGAGAAIPYEIVITNTGNRAVNNINLADPNAPACAGAKGNLAPGASTTVECTRPTGPANLGQTLLNTATATGSGQTKPVAAAITPVISNTVSTLVEVPAPALDITKTAIQSSVTAGADIDYDIVVENTGNVPLTGVNIDDPTVPDCDSNVGTLGIGASAASSCDYTTTDADVGTFSNTATADSNETGPASDTANVTVSRPLQFCGGFVVTVDIGAGDVPTNGDDVILGTNGPDVINGLGGDDVICGLGGADVLRGGSGADVLRGGNGPDTLYGGNGADRLKGGGGDDRLFGQRGNDSLDGGPGRDRCDGGRPGTNTGVRCFSRINIP